MAGGSEAAFLSPIVLFTICVLSGTVFIVTWLTKRSKINTKETAKPQVKGSQPSNTKSKVHGPRPSKKKGPIPKGNIATQHKFDHPHLLTTLKGHTGQLTGGEFSANGKQFITSAEDRTVLIWNTKDFTNRNRRSVRGNIDFDHAQHICWSPDSKAFVIFKERESAIEVYKLSKPQNGSLSNIRKAITFPEYNRNVLVISLGVAVNGKFLMTCDEKNHVTLWDLKGKILEKFDTRHGDTYSAIISPCGRFIATTGFTPDCKVWEVKYNKNGSYECVKRVFDLTGHAAGIYNCGITCDSSKMVTVSKDGTWRLYTTLVDYEQGQDPYFVMSGQYKKCEFPAYVSISPDGRAIALASGPDLTFYSAITGENLYCIENVYSDYIKGLRFDPGNKFLLTLGDKHARVFHNVAGYQAAIQDLEKSKGGAKTSAMRERITAQIAEAKSALKEIDAGL